MIHADETQAEISTNRKAMVFSCMGTDASDFNGPSPNKKMTRVILVISLNHGKWY